MVATEGKLPRLILGIAFCVGLALCAQVGATDQKPASGAAVPSAKDSSKLKELLKERLATAREFAAQTTKAYQAGSLSFDRVHQATLILLNAELELCESGKDRIAVLEKIVAQTKANEENVVARLRAGQAPQADAFLAKVGRLEAEIALERANSKTATNLPAVKPADEAEVFNTKASPQFVLIVDVEPDVVKPVDNGKDEGKLGKPEGRTFTVALSKLVVNKKIEPEIYTLQLFLRDFRLTDAGGKDVDWGKAKGKVVFLNWSSQEIDPVYVKLLSKDAWILSRKK